VGTRDDDPTVCARGLPRLSLIPGLNKEGSFTGAPSAKDIPLNRELVLASSSAGGGNTNDGVEEFEGPREVSTTGDGGFEVAGNFPSLTKHDN